MRWIVNIATSYLSFVVSIVAVFFLTPFIVSKIGMDLFGLWSLIFAIVAMFGMLDLGFATAAVKYMGEFAGSDDRKGRNEVLATLFVVYTGLGLVCITTVAVVSNHAGDWFNLTSQTEQLFTIALWMLGCAVAINLPLNLVRAILNGGGHMAVTNTVEIVVTLVNASVIALTLHLGYGMLGLIVTTATTMVLANVVMIPFAFHYTPGLSLNPVLFSRKRVREVMDFSLFFFLANVAVLLILRIDPVVIKSFLPLTAVAVYAIGAKIAEYAYYLNKQFSNALMPLVSQSKGGGKEEVITRVLMDGTRFSLSIAVPFVSLLFFYADDVILLWMGDEFAGSIPVLRILLVAIFFTAVQLNAANVIAMNGDHRFTAYAMLSSAAINLVLSLIFIQFFGLNGVAFATLIAAFTIEMLVIVPRACRARNIPALRFFTHAVGPSIPPLLPSLAVAWGLAELQPPSNFLWLLLEGGAAALVYFTVFAATALSPEERAFARAKLSALRRGRAPVAEGGA
ncbi:MAG: flippase [Thiohalocapsa sp.]|nr:flippase [Thiohalocapsa sp.]MCF7991028.1 flippase [Thiohalocapsa sp.]